jgi:hypothetical protein
MKNHFGVLSLVILLLTVKISLFLMFTKHKGMLDEYVGIFGFGLTVLFLLLSKKGRLKRVLL